MTSVTTGTTHLPDITEDDLQDTIRLLDAHSGKLHLTSASMSPPSCRRCRRRRRRYRRAQSSLSPRGTASLSESTEDDLQDAHSGDAASNIGTNVPTVLSSLSPSPSSPCLPPTPATASPSAQTMSLTASLRPPSYSPASPPPPYLSVHPLTDIPHLTDTQLMRFAIGQLVWLLDVVRHNVTTCSGPETSQTWMDDASSVSGGTGLCPSRRCPPCPWRNF